MNRHSTSNRGSHHHVTRDSRKLRLEVKLCVLVRHTRGSTFILSKNKIKRKFKQANKKEERPRQEGTLL